ncbi:hypothetical protein O181_053154 [Austropuccinia psidii MF-1]|uniref:Tc1-like transposase DDE domain-containing protein n=1 Tax=Austropuccinia psidii MF-1 TaxID=1389203 RepID=A0A9Q3E243_9BASI|nr:hypothetical protein [Austropuccinia psidii MF-1]
MNEQVEVGMAGYCEELTLIEDRAPIYTSISSQHWKDENENLKLVWPAYSPALNPIKMKYIVMHILNPKKMDKLKNSVNSVWETLPLIRMRPYSYLCLKVSRW